jgi:lycopene cyclase CruA
MQTHAHIDIELPAPLDAVRAALLSGDFWPLGAAVGPALWQWRQQTWRVRAHHDRYALRWSAESATSWHCYTTIQLLAAATSTHLRMHVALDQPVSVWRGLLSQWPAARQLRREVQLAGARLRQRWITPAPTSGDLAATHPLTAAAFSQMGAAAELERIRQLDARWTTFEQGKLPATPHCTATPLPSTTAEYDLIYAGGGLGLLHAALMAQRGYRVLLFDRYPVGCAHREWNISHAELDRLVGTGLVSWDELEREIIMARYADGLVRFHAAGSAVPAAELRLPGVLDIALDAGALLQLARRRFEAAGGTVWEGYSFAQAYADPGQPGRTVVALDAADGRVYLGARLMIDGMGATSPLTLGTQPFSGICPTVGTVVEGVLGHDPQLGDILISVADTQGDRQLIWEGFPGRADELTVYVFYYDQVGAQAQHRHSLLNLFEDYFALLPTYKTLGPDFQHLRPVYGYIPARHAIGRPAPLLGVLPLGDASAQQSPLTFCGFGSFVRNLQRTTDLLDLALRQGLLSPADLRLVSAHQANVSLNWVFSRFMIPWGRPQDVNELQNVFARVLNVLGLDVARRFFQDQMTWRDYRIIIMGTLQLYPAIMRTALQVLGWRGIGRWVADWLRFSRSAFLSYCFQRMLPRLIPLVEPLHPALAFRWRAHQAEWHAMGWLGNER